MKTRCTTLKPEFDIVPKSAIPAGSELGSCYTNGIAICL